MGKSGNFGGGGGKKDIVETPHLRGISLILQTFSRNSIERGIAQYLQRYSRKSIYMELGRIPVVSCAEKKILHVFI